jgi:uncharacterized membrane protein YjjP (DUF1212 family)
VTRIGQRAFCMLLLLGHVIVCAGQAAIKYGPWLAFWITVTTTIGLVFIVQTLREHR